MEVKAFLDKTIIDKILKSIEKNPGVGFKLLDFITSCDELCTYQGMWEKSKRNLDYFRLLNPNGKSFYKIPDNKDFKDLIIDSRHFSLSVSDKKNEDNLKSETPILTFQELITSTDQCKQTAFYMKSVDELEKAALIHSPTSIIINDRYFFEKGNPESFLTKIIENLIHHNYSGRIILTIFYSNSNKSIQKEDVKEMCLQIGSVLTEEFINADFIIESFENILHNVTHDRFLFTDLLCYKSEKSFNVLMDKHSTVIHRYPIFQGIDFIENVKYLSEFLEKASRDIQKSQNGIIKSFLSKRKTKII